MMRPVSIFLGQRRRGDGLGRAEEGEKCSFARTERAKGGRGIFQQENIRDLGRNPRGPRLSFLKKSAASIS